MSHELLRLNGPWIPVVLRLVSLSPTCCHLLNSSPFLLSLRRCSAPRQEERPDQRDTAARVCPLGAAVFFSRLSEGKGSTSCHESANSTALCLDMDAKSGSLICTEWKEAAQLVLRLALRAGSPSELFHQRGFTPSVWELANCPVIVAFVLIAYLMPHTCWSNARASEQLCPHENWWLSPAQTHWNNLLPPIKYEQPGKTN